MLGTLTDREGDRRAAPRLAFLGSAGDWHTLDYLVEARARYVADWINDDQPYLMDVGGKRLCSIPYSVEINDLPQILRAGRSADEFELMIRRQFDTLYREGAQSGRVMAICLHPFVIGVPHRIGALDSALAYILRHEGVSARHRRRDRRSLPRLRRDVLIRVKSERRRNLVEVEIDSPRDDSPSHGGSYLRPRRARARYFQDARGRGPSPSRAVSWRGARRSTARRHCPHGLRKLEAAGNLDNLRIAAGRRTGPFRGRVFMDSDVYKWLEAAAFEMARAPSAELSASSRGADRAGGRRPEPGRLPQLLLHGRRAGSALDRPRPRPRALLRRASDPGRRRLPARHRRRALAGHRPAVRRPHPRGVRPGPARDDGWPCRRSRWRWSSSTARPASGAISTWPVLPRPAGTRSDRAEPLR